MKILRYVLSLLAFAPLAAGQTAGMSFTYKVGGFVPPPQTVDLTIADGSVPNLVAQVVHGDSWIVAVLNGAQSPCYLTVSVDPSNLAPGTYSGTVVITSAAGFSWLGPSLVIVSLTVEPPVLITNVANAAFPALDLAPNTVSLAPRSMATIYGTNLADSAASSAPPWVNTLGETEVHLASATCTDPSCDLIAGLIYASPSQINFLVPDTADTGPILYRIVLLRDGERIDNLYMGPGPGRVIIDPSGTADYNVVFQTGYDCLFSASLSDPASCGLSWTGGEDRAPVGAVTDALSGQLISTQNPIYQGRLVTLWMTALYGGVTLNSATGLRTANTIAPVAFGVAESGKDLTTSFMSPMPLWAGESPQFIGLDQMNVEFPTCTNAPLATTEKRYDAFLTYTSHETGSTARIYLPFSVRPGDPDCSW